jgi:hypothetical protein
MQITLTNIIIGIACIVVANLLLVSLRMVVDMPWGDGLESTLATGVGVLAWFFIVARLKKA